MFVQEIEEVDRWEIQVDMFAGQQYSEGQTAEEGLGGQQEVQA